MELAELLTHTMRRLRRGTREALAPLGLSGSDARVIRLLADGPLRMAAIAERLAVVPRTATDMVDRVEAAGLVARRADPDDRRSVLVELTLPGRRLLHRLETARRESAAQVFVELTPGRRADLLSLLRTLCARDHCPACAADAANPPVGTVAGPGGPTAARPGETIERPKGRPGT
jgi:DNA-binding MarR family transcriptional regulator